MSEESKQKFRVGYITFTAKELRSILFACLKEYLVTKGYNIESWIESKDFEKIYRLYKNYKDIDNKDVIYIDCLIALLESASFSNANDAYIFKVLRKEYYRPVQDFVTETPKQYIKIKREAMIYKGERISVLSLAEESKELVDAVKRASAFRARWKEAERK